ncbi:hypothetical protein ACHAPT_008046 [Fusarium lateritium]
MLIADHARKDVPPGSYSWKFIEDSVKNGIIQIKDKYRIGPDPDLPRPVGAKHGAKSTRTPFTKVDDANLAKWVLSQTAPQLGNAIYQDYEKINPRHTWQSWRDRFVKQLQPRGRVALEKLAAEAPDEAHVSEPAAPAAAPPQRVTTERRQTARIPVEPQIVRRAEPQSARLSNPTPERAPERLQGQDHSASVPQEDPGRLTFYDDLDDYINSTGAEIKDRININGRTIDLFTLAVAFNHCQADSQEFDWYQVAERLGFEDPDDDTATQIKVCYDEYLGDFLASMSTFDPIGEDNVEPEAEGLEEEPYDQGMPEASSQWPASYVPSSPPVVVGRKRSAGQRQLSAGHGTKRPRYDKDMVIPSTPDADLDVDLPVAENSPSVRKSSQWRGYIDESEASQHLPPLPHPQAESQDLGTGHSPISVPRRQTVAATRECQQEALDSTPIPFSLKRPREQRESASRQAPRVEPPKTSHKTLRTSQQESSKSNRREIQRWTNHYESQGFPRDIVVEALKRTTLTPGTLALQVMESLKADCGVPSHHEGIWTDRDDADLAFVSSVDFSHSPKNNSEELQQQRAQKAHNRLIKKHTLRRFELRKAFLQAQSDQGN